MYKHLKRATSEWIPTIVELPEKDYFVLTSDVYNEQDIMKLVEDPTLPAGLCWETLRPDDRYDLIDVLAWMPLPALFNECERDQQYIGVKEYKREIYKENRRNRNA